MDVGVLLIVCIVLVVIDCLTVVNCDLQSVKSEEDTKPDCFVWHFKSNGMCLCGNELDGYIKCSENCLFIKDAYCITWDNTTNTQWFSYCLITQHNSQTKGCNRDEVGLYTIEAHTSGPQLNNITCSSAHRKGRQCSQCVEGYGPAVLSDNISCASCSKHKHMWILNVFLQLAMVTLMYFIFTLLQVKGTSSPFNVLLTYGQLVVNAVMHDSALYGRLTQYIGTKGTMVTLTILGVSNLDFFRFIIPPLCISTSMRYINVLLFEYITVIFPILLTFVVYFCIQLHDQNCKLIVFISLPIRKLFNFVQEDWNPKQSLLSTFATFFILSYSKVLFVSINLLFAVQSYDVHGHPIPNSTVMLYDPTIRFLSSEHIPYSITALVVVFVFTFFPPLFLLLYPTRLSAYILTCCGFQRWDALHMIMDTFQGWYKDGTEGTQDYRPLSALYMLLRIGLAVEFLVVVYVNSHQRESLKWFVAGTVHILLGTFFLVIKPYKKQWMNITDGYILTSFGLIILMGNYREKDVYIVIATFLFFHYSS